MTAFAKNDLKVLIVGNEQEFWDKVTSSQKIELKLILEEMMINMQKHSDAGNVLVHFRHSNDTGFIHYKDDGVGFPSPFKFGNGLNNTVTRIKSMKGEINFEKSGDRGISLSISFPLKFSIS